jgi:hypothetical protein
MRKAQAIGALLACSMLLHAGNAGAAAPHVHLRMRFRPDKPGASTTISFGFSVERASPVRTVQLRLPAGMGFASATLGFATCDPAIFRLEGAKGCPADSRVGHGTAYAEAPFEENGPKDVYETARVAVFFGPIEGNAQIVLFWIEGKLPATYSQAIVARALPAAPPYGESLTMEVPLLSAASEGPYVDLRGFTATIGPEDTTYYLHEHGKAIPFKPRGVSVPDHCPRIGYPVDATFTWWEGLEPSRAVTRVPCPKRRTR